MLTEAPAQVENFGVHVAESGFVSYGLRMDAVMDLQHTSCHHVVHHVVAI